VSSVGVHSCLVYGRKAIDAAGIGVRATKARLSLLATAIVVYGAVIPLEFVRYGVENAPAGNRPAPYLSPRGSLLPPGIDRNGLSRHAIYAGRAANIVSHPRAASRPHSLQQEAPKG
jgi:hypothetical protein